MALIDLLPRLARPQSERRPYELRFRTVERARARKKSQRLNVNITRERSRSFEPRTGTSPVQLNVGFAEDEGICAFANAEARL